MPKTLIIDSSTVFALERAGLIHFLKKINAEIIIPPAVKKEILQSNSVSLLNYLKLKPLNGRTLEKSRTLEKLGIGAGEAECCSLAANLGLKFIVCDDRKFIRQRFFSNDADLKKIVIVGFSFFLHLFHKKRLIKDVWKTFNKIIDLNNWQRSEVQVANHTFLKGLGY
ncbi:hypothetical protein HY837_04495 [archaeon]|nr:hypothetical protein [archaeon]